MADENPQPAGGEMGPAPIGGEFKPNIYPIMYWALTFGALAGVLLWLLFLLSRFVTILWFPVFLAGLVWGGYRNYKRQKRTWATRVGKPYTPGTPMEEFRQAVNDVVDASRRVMTEERGGVPTDTSADVLEEPEELPPRQTPPSPPPVPPAG